MSILSISLIAYYGLIAWSKCEIKNKIDLSYPDRIFVCLKISRIISSYRPTNLINIKTAFIGLYCNSYLKWTECYSLSTCAVVPGVSYIIKGF